MKPTITPSLINQVGNFLLSHASGNAVILLDNQFCIIALNEQAEQIYNWKRQDVVGKSYFNVCLEYKQEPLFLKSNFLISAGKPLLNVENVISHASKNDIAMLWNVNPIKSTAIRKLNFLLVGQEITQYKKEEIRAKNIQLYLDGIIAYLPGIIFWKDKNSVYLGCNENLTSVFGVKSRKDIIGKTDYDFTWTREEADRVVNDDKEVLRTGIGKLNIIEAVPLPDGTLHHVLTNKVPLLDASGNIIGLMGTATDINEQIKNEIELAKAKERAELANKAKSEFLGIMSHELRTPLNAIMGMTQVLSTEENLLKKQRDCISTIANSSKYLLALITDILDFATIEAGELQINPIPFKLHSIFKEISEFMSFQAKERKLKFLTGYDENIPEVLIGDARRIRQILINLISNAIKFTPQGHIRLIAKCLHKTDSEVQLHLAIEDTGVGIPQRKLKTIFDKFMQVDSSYQRRHDGVGLGLSICKQLTEAMGGKIKAQSTTGVGSTFIISLTLPITTQANIQAIDKLEKSVTAQNKLSKQNAHHILLIEDNKINQKIATLLLTELNCKIDVADNGKQALKMLNNNYDLIFMDIGLPDMDGLQVTKEIRRREKNKKHTPIIAMTAHVLDSDRQQCLAAGIDAITTKPIMQDELRKVIDTWCS